MGKRSLAGFFMTVAKGRGCVKAQSWHPEGAGSVLGSSTQSPFLIPDLLGSCKGGAASSHPQLGLGTAGNVTLVWLCHPQQGCAWGCGWHGKMLGEMPPWHSKPRCATLAGHWQGPWALAGEMGAARGGEDSRDMELPGRTRTSAGDKESRDFPTEENRFGRKGSAVGFKACL